MTKFSLYGAALKADNAFEAAIKKQFGDRANRFDHASKAFNSETLAALSEKKKADEKWIKGMRSPNLDQQG